MPVGSDPCERFFSALRRLKLWNLTTTTDHKLNGLQIHKDRDIDRALVLDKFDASGNRRIGALLAFIISYKQRERKKVTSELDVL